MRPWGELTERGRLRRLRAVAQAALAEYDLDVQRLRLVGGFTNAVYRLDTAAGRYAIRVDLHLDHDDRDTEIELQWLTALHRDTDLSIVEPIAARDGRLFVKAAAAGVPEQRKCTVFAWVGGKPLADRVSPSSYRQMGELAAGLHEHGASYRCPQVPMLWDRTFYWPEDVDPVVIDDADRQGAFRHGDKDVIDAARRLAARAFERLPASGRHIVHGDLHPWNVHVIGSRLMALDFEDLMWADPVQDIAISLFYLRDRPDHAELCDAFAEGYRTVRSWPVRYDGELEHFMAARTLMFINYTMNLGSVEEFLPTAIPRLGAFVDRWG